MTLSFTPLRAAAIATEVETSPTGISPASVLRMVVPPPEPAVMPSISRPAALNMPFSRATAQGSVPAIRPYWEIVRLAAVAGVAIATAASATTKPVRTIVLLLRSAARTPQLVIVPQFAVRVTREDAVLRLLCRPQGDQSGRREHDKVSGDCCCSTLHAQRLVAISGAKPPPNTVASCLAMTAPLKRTRVGNCSG